MRKAFVALVGSVAGALLALAHPAGAQPAAAQDQPIPRVYSDTGFEKAYSGKSEDRRAREAAAADAAAARCESGEAAGCTLLGEAFETGAGRPQSRPVAELVYRQACTGGDAAGCFGLARLLRHADREGDQRVSAALYVRACSMGVLRACDAQANDLAFGVSGPPDPAAALALRRTTCAKGNAETCNLLAALLLRSDRPADQAEGLALHDRQCRAGQALDCSALVRHWEALEGRDSPRVREAMGLGCAAGAGGLCHTLATWILREAPPESLEDDPRTLAIPLLDRACADSDYYCPVARALRSEDQLRQTCPGGVAADCLTLARAYGDVAGPLGNLDEAAMALGFACEAPGSAADLGPRCARAGEEGLRRLEQSYPAFDAARVEAWLIRACAVGWEEGCTSLAAALADGQQLTADLPRALAIWQRQCDAAYPDGCASLRRASQLVPDAPLLTAASTTPPPDYTEEEIAAMLRAEDEAARMADERAFAAACTTTEVEWQGVVYIDTICVPAAAIRNGFTVPRGGAPWQALLWRPGKLAGVTLRAEERVLCGGAVIARGWILTAAHCLTDEVRNTRLPIQTAGHRIRLGVTNPLNLDEGFSYPILEVIPHPDYRRDQKLIFDIALVRYDAGRGEGGRSAQTVEEIRIDPKPLGARPIAARMPVYTFGWGRTALEGGALPNVLRGARLELRSAQQCNALTGFTDVRKDAVLCAAGARGEQACYGDSGGALITYADDGAGPTVLGVVSAGVKCGTTGVPSRFTRVAHPKVQAWLRQHMPAIMRR